MGRQGVWRLDCGVALAMIPRDSPPFEKKGGCLAAERFVYIYLSGDFLHYESGHH